MSAKDELNATITDLSIDLKGLIAINKNLERSENTRLIDISITEIETAIIRLKHTEKLM